MTFEELYQTTLKNVLTGNELCDGGKASELDCLLHPEKYAAVAAAGGCTHCNAGRPCVKSCIFDAICVNADQSLYIDLEKCKGCLACVDACKEHKLQTMSDTVAAIKAVRNREILSYALVAPAFLGQFSHDVTPGKLRNALKALGFDGMIEVALFADILTLKEALEFDKNIQNGDDYQLTSCCCPIWIAMIRKVYNELMPHVPGSVSPMIACGRMIKMLHKDAATVFIGPCVAKKSEAREADVAGAIDYVLTFREVQELFELAEINPANCAESEKDHSSRAGRIYAKSGGVSEAVQDTVAKLNSNRKIPLQSRKADGVPACRKMIEEIKAGCGNANFFEGMGCVGGCVGGPKAIIGKEEAASNVDRYGNDAKYKTPLDNPYVFELLKQLGINSVEELLEHSEIFNRDF